jgi:hypothetical protein
MYDYVKDPLEKVNVVNEKAYEKDAQDLKGKVLTYLKSNEGK